MHPSPSPTTRPASPIQDYLDELHARFSELRSGQVATYIPELAKADPDWFGIAIATVDGHVYEVGATRQQFTIQSISKPLVYGVALEDRGAEAVRATRSASSLAATRSTRSASSRDTGRPMNPMINAGAIATAVAGRAARARRRGSRGSSARSRPTRAGRSRIDEAVFESERATGHRNRAIGHMLRNYEILGDDPEPALDLYFRQCSVLVDCRDLALIGGDAGQRRRQSGQRRSAPSRAEYVEPILSVMTTCGMYDFAGEWVYRVGMPAKSGVGGGIVAVLPGQLGIGVFSPALDERGNSVRGVEVCEALSRELGLHFLQPPRTARTTVRARYTLATMRSKRRRSAAEKPAARRAGRPVRGLRAAGRPALRDPGAGAARDRASPAPRSSSRCSTSSASRTSTKPRRACSPRSSRALRGARPPHRADAGAPRRAARVVRQRRSTRGTRDAVIFQPQLDARARVVRADAARARAPRRAATPPIGGPGRASLVQGVAAADLAYLRGATWSAARTNAGTLIVQRGDVADRLYFLVRGDVSVVLALPHGGYKRLSTLTRGHGLRRAGRLIAGGVRSADVRADTAVECWILHRDALARVERERPALALIVMRNLLLSTIETVRRLTADVASLES